MRSAYLVVTNTVTLLRVLPMSDRDKDIEILALRHQLLVPQRQVGIAGADKVIRAGQKPFIGDGPTRTGCPPTDVALRASWLAVLLRLAYLVVHGLIRPARRDRATAELARGASDHLPRRSDDAAVAGLPRTGE